MLIIVIPNNSKVFVQIIDIYRTLWKLSVNTFLLFCCNPYLGLHWLHDGDCLEEDARLFKN